MSPKKVFATFWEMELSELRKKKKKCTPKKFLVFSLKMFFLNLWGSDFVATLIFFQKKDFFIFRELELFKESYYISGGNFRSPENISYISANGTS